MSRNKPLIVFEGIEGTGKTTLINYVTRYLSKNKISFIKIREPGGSKNSELIRKLILNKKNKFNPFTDLMLYFAGRSENIEKIINKYYKKRIIIIDRFTDSTLAYQHYGMHQNKFLINNINKFLLKKIKPKIIFLNTINKKNLKKRLNLRKNKNRYDNFKIKFYLKVQKGFLKIAKNKKNYILINSNNKLVNNKKIVLNNINKFIN
tara:strand:- start:5663 stop:6280 length:618 start_codon:yes stop_codon:yes gene_type:complete